MTRRRAAVALAVALAVAPVLVGCSGDGTPQAKPSAESTTSATPEAPDVSLGPVVWSARGRDRSELLGLSDSVLLVADDDTRGETELRALDPDTGRVLWRDGDTDVGLDAPVSVADSETSAVLGDDGRGGDLVVVPYQRYDCGSGGCRRSVGLEARDARDGRRLWRAVTGRGPTPEPPLTGILVGEGVVTLRLGGAVVALDAGTGERLWREPGDLDAVQLDDGRVLLGSARRDHPSDVRDARTGRGRRVVDDLGDTTTVLVGGVATVTAPDELRLEDVASSAEPWRQEYEQGDGPVPIPGTGGRAWLVVGDGTEGTARLLTLVPGESEPVDVPAPRELDLQTVFLASFVGDLDGGTVIVPTDEGVVMIGRDGGPGEPSGPRVAGVAVGSSTSVVVRREAGRQSWLEVRQIR